MTIRIFLVDDHDLVRQGIRLLLDTDEELEVVGDAANAIDALTGVAATNPHVAIIDVRLGDDDGVEVCRDIRSMLPECSCIMLTSFNNNRALSAAVIAGASGFILKQIDADDLITKVKAVASGRSLIDAHVLAEVISQLSQPLPTSDPGLASLTAQELRILDQIGEGRTNRQIAEKLFLAESTVKNYVTALLRKLGLSSRTEAAIYYTSKHAGDDESGTAT